MANNLEMDSISKVHLRLLKPKEYFERFYELLPIYQNQREAYLAVEKELFDSFMVSRFSSYESFKSNKLKCPKKIILKH